MATLSSILTPSGVATLGSAQTITNKTIAFADNTLTNVASTNTAQTLTGVKRGSVTTDNDGSLDLAVGNNFAVTPAAGITLTFTNIASSGGQSGFIKFVNGSNYAIAAHANTKITATDLSRISATGTYILSYFCDGTVVFVTSSGNVA
jgi:hypothetical protein